MTTRHRKKRAQQAAMARQALEDAAQGVHAMERRWAEHEGLPAGPGAAYPPGTGERQACEAVWAHGQASPGAMAADDWARAFRAFGRAGVSLQDLARRLRQAGEALQGFQAAWDALERETPSP